MNINLQIRLIFIFFCLLGISSCNNNSVNETTESNLESAYPAAYPDPDAETIRLNITSTRVVEVVPPQENLSTLTGVVFSERTNKPIVEIPVQLAEVYYEGDQGAFVLDTAQSPFTTTDRNGRFAFIDIKAQDYVLVIGNVEVNDYAIISNEGGGNVVWTAPPNDILDTGTHVVLLDSWE